MNRTITFNELRKIKDSLPSGSMPSIPYNDVFSYQGPDEESIKNIIKKVNEDLNNLSDKIKSKIDSGEFPNVKFSCVLKEGIPEEEILRYAKNTSPGIIVMWVIFTQNFTDNSG